MKLYPHQNGALLATKDKNRVAYYHDMGLGKTFTGSEKMMQLGAKVNLIICQKSKIDDWIEHFKKYYPEMHVFDLTDKNSWEYVLHDCPYLLDESVVLVINYELAWRRPDLKKLDCSGFTLMLDESSLIQNETSKRSRFILNLHPTNIILLSGTPTGGKYEKLWSQLHLLGWPISKKLYWKQYVDTEIIDNEGYPITTVKGYKNVDRLKRKMRQYGCHFLKTEEVLDLPEQINQTIRIPATKEYKKFRKDSIVLVEIPGWNKSFYADDAVEVVRAKELVGDTTLTKMLYERQLCGQYNEDKLQAFKDLVESTNDRLIVFYNFGAELDSLIKLIPAERRFSFVNGHVKALEAYEQCDYSITFIQYQAGAMGLNLQKANKIVYFTPPLSSELFEQSKKRIYRIGQQKPCFYYYLTCRNSIEEKIYKTLAMRESYTAALFEEDK